MGCPIPKANGFNMKALERGAADLADKLVPDYDSVVDAAALDKAIHLLKLKRTLAEQEYEQMNQQGLRWQYAAEVDKLEHRLENDDSLVSFDRQHIRGRIACLKAKCLRSEHIAAIAQMTINVYRRALKD
jgi:hypothetical protein